MLILTRRPGETIIIETPAGERIQVAVLGQKGNHVVQRNASIVYVCQFG